MILTYKKTLFFCSVMKRTWWILVEIAHLSSRSTISKCKLPKEAKHLFLHRYLELLHPRITSYKVVFQCEITEEPVVIPIHLLLLWVVHSGCGLSLLNKIHCDVLLLEVSRHCVEMVGLPCSNGSVACHWKFISQIFCFGLNFPRSSSIVLFFSVPSYGEGATICFWEDVWVGETHIS